MYSAVPADWSKTLYFILFSDRHSEATIIFRFPKRFFHVFMCVFFVPKAVWYLLHAGRDLHLKRIKN